ncbi:hypothetical protein H4S08_004485 [Coemansia sp. RSA 1365]|nr:hypothetical protein H4S08_004485 [Coemansia sp. RSA 1365]
MSEDITTIFVVGFPDDMREREFQNMFTFSPGFEAATLKIPGPDDTDRDSQKKQIIGFAKFHTRLEALEARDVLTGRKVDAEKNCALKAEMAKKNLHTKRGLSSLGLSSAMSATFGLDTPTTGLGFQQQQQHGQHSLSSHTPQSQSTQHISGASGTPGVVRTASLTNTMLASAHRPEHLRISGARTFNPFNDAPLASAPILGAGAHRGGFGSGQYSSAFSSNADTMPTAAPMQQVPGTAGVMGGFMYSEQQMPSNAVAASTHPGMLLNRRGSVHGSTPATSSLAMSSISISAQQPQAQSQHPSNSETISSDSDALQMGEQAQQQKQAQQKGLGSQRPAVLDIGSLQPRLGQLNLGQLSAGNLMSPMGVPYSAAVSTPVGMVLPMATTRSVNSNDQNPPCNTLYVGNLPIGAKEDELRQAFQAALGYKRMSFKAKPNSGPMCFVEFESIDFATLAMNDLDGRMLSNSVGGGIRLSYSKNPLGVRSQTNPNPSTPVSSAPVLGSAAVAGGGFHHINGSPYGYAASTIQNQQQPQQYSQQQTYPQQSYPQHNRKISPISQPMSAALRPGATPSPTGSALQTRGTAMSANHRHSMSSSSQVSPIPSPGEKGSFGGEHGAVPQDALSFLHQPIHQLHKQAAKGPAGSTTPPQSTTNGTVNNATNIALDQ